jgi:hypothetical protein
MLQNAKLRAALPRRANVKVTRPVLGTGKAASVTVVVPCYNYGHYVATCVQSVLDQVGVEVDVLVIDDASPDGSADVVSALPDHDDRVRVICHRENVGHIATFNEGLAQAKGDYTVLLSADDMLTPGCLSRATAVLERNPHVGMAYGAPLIFSDDNIPIARSDATAWIIWSGLEWIAHRCRTGYNSLRSPEAVMRTSVLNEIGHYRADLPHAADFELWMRAAAVSGIAYIAGADQAYYRIHDSNMHHSSFDMTADLAQRLRCFDITFGQDARPIPGADAMRELAHRTLAAEALRHAMRACALREADQQLLDRYTSFARQACPDCQRSREWRTLGKLRRAPANSTRRRFLTLRQRAASSVEYNLRDWRLRSAGI